LERCLVAVGEPPQRRERQVVAMAHAGAGAAPFASWHAGLGEDVALRAVRLPGRESRLKEDTHRSIPAMAEEVGAALLGAEEAPTVLYGHCMGGLTMYEVARLLCAEGFPVEKLIVSSQPAPMLLAEAEVAGAGVSELPADRFWLAVREHGGVPEEIFEHPPLLKLLEPALRSDWGAVERYEGSTAGALPVPILAILGSRDPIVSRKEVEAWDNYTSEDFGLEEVDGDHFLLAAGSAHAVRQLVTG
jgi:surfactin synthase thioesterase subunit